MSGQRLVGLIFMSIFVFSTFAVSAAAKSSTGKVIPIPGSDCPMYVIEAEVSEAYWSKNYCENFAFSTGEDSGFYKALKLCEDSELTNKIMQLYNSIECPPSCPVKGYHTVSTSPGLSRWTDGPDINNRKRPRCNEGRAFGSTLYCMKTASFACYERKPNVPQCPLGEAGPKIGFVKDSTDHSSGEGARLSAGDLWNIDPDDAVLITPEDIGFDPALKQAIREIIRMDTMGSASSSSETTQTVKEGDTVNVPLPDDFPMDIAPEGVIPVNVDFETDMSGDLKIKLDFELTEDVNVINMSLSEGEKEMKDINIGSETIELEAELIDIVEPLQTDTLALKVEGDKVTLNGMVLAIKDEDSDYPVSNAMVTYSLGQGVTGTTAGVKSDFSSTGALIQYDFGEGLSWYYLTKIERPSTTDRFRGTEISSSEWEAPLLEGRDGKAAEFIEGLSEIPRGQNAHFIIRGNLQLPGTFRIYSAEDDTLKEKEQIDDAAADCSSSNARCSATIETSKIEDGYYYVTYSDGKVEITKPLALRVGSPGEKGSSTVTLQDLKTGKEKVLKWTPKVTHQDYVKGNMNGRDITVVQWREKYHPGISIGTSKEKVNYDLKSLGFPGLSFYVDTDWKTYTKLVFNNGEIIELKLDGDLTLIPSKTGDWGDGTTATADNAQSVVISTNDLKQGGKSAVIKFKTKTKSTATTSVRLIRDSDTKKIIDAIKQGKNLIIGQRSKIKDLIKKPCGELIFPQNKPIGTTSYSPDAMSSIMAASTSPTTTSATQYISETQQTQHKTEAPKRKPCNEGSESLFEERNGKTYVSLGTQEKGIDIEGNLVRMDWGDLEVEITLDRDIGKLIKEAVESGIENLQPGEFHVGGDTYSYHHSTNDFESGKGTSYTEGVSTTMSDGAGLRLITIMSSAKEWEINDFNNAEVTGKGSEQVSIYIYENGMIKVSMYDFYTGERTHYFMDNCGNVIASTEKTIEDSYEEVVSEFNELKPYYEQFLKLREEYTVAATFDESYTGRQQGAVEHDLNKLKSIMDPLLITFKKKCSQIQEKINAKEDSLFFIAEWFNGDLRELRKRMAAGCTEFTKVWEHTFDV